MPRTDASSSPTRRTRQAVSRLGAVLLALVLVGCVLARPQLEAGDVITVTQPNFTLEGAFGEETVRIEGRTVTVSYRVPADVPPIYDVEFLISPAERHHLEELTAAYIAYADSPGSARADECTDTALDTVQVSGSIEHESEMMNCRPDTPLQRLLTALGEITAPVTEELARPSQDWTIEVMPLEPGSLVGSAEERYHLFPGEISTPEWVTAECAPEGWGESQAPGFREREIELDGEASAAVLTALNQVQLDEQPDCTDAAQELRLTRTGREKATTWTYPLCPEGPTAALLAELRGL